MGIQPTASKTALLLQCGRPFAEDTELGEREVGPEAIYGSCIHELLARSLSCNGVNLEQTKTICDRWGIEDMLEARAHVDSILKCLELWCVENPWGRQFRVVTVEWPQGTKVSKCGNGRSYTTDFDAASHTYDLRPDEIGGSFDVLLRSIDLDGTPSINVVVDLKTGTYGDFTRPEVLPQMQTLVLQTRTNPAFFGEVWAAAILHAPAGWPPVMYCSDEIGAEDSRAHAMRLFHALVRVGDRSLTPGPECGRCPAREACPANDGSLLARSGAMVKAANEALSKDAVDPGALHQFLATFDTLAKRARLALRARVEAGEVITRPDGAVLTLVPKEVENLSKASVVRAMGKHDGERVLAELRTHGAIEKTTRVEMRAVKPGSK